MGNQRFTVGKIRLGIGRFGLGHRGIGLGNCSIGLSHDARITLREDHRMRGGKIGWKRFRSVHERDGINIRRRSQDKSSSNRRRAPGLLRMTPVDAREQVTELGRRDRHRAVRHARPQKPATF